MSSLCSKDTTAKSVPRRAECDTETSLLIDFEAACREYESNE